MTILYGTGSESREEILATLDWIARQIRDTEAIVQRASRTEGSDGFIVWASFRPVLRGLVREYDEAVLFFIEHCQHGGMTVGAPGTSWRECVLCGAIL